MEFAAGERGGALNRARCRRSPGEGEFKAAPPQHSHDGDCASPADPPLFAEYSRYDATGLAALIAHGEVTDGEVLQAAPASAVLAAICLPMEAIARGPLSDLSGTFSPRRAAAFCRNGTGKLMVPSGDSP